MRSLVALALFVLGVACAHHTPEHQLSYPRFVNQKTHLYDVTINVTSGIPGLHSQVSKSVINMELKIFAKTPKELVLSMEKVMVSNSVPGEISDIDAVSMKPDRSLEDKLRKPITAVFEDGKVISYTLDPEESLESAKIKRTILRNLEVYLDKEYVQGDYKQYPLTYNRTLGSRWGNYNSHYVVTSSPYVNFPKELNVWNITRQDNLEVLPYFAYESHHNFEKQGCPEVCKKNYTENKYGAGCPVGYEPHNTPLKRSFSQQHNLRMLKSGEPIIDMIRTKETHVADLYDQNMEISIKTLIKFQKTTTETLSEKSGQQTYTNLNDMSKEINEEEIKQFCGYPDARQAVQAVKTLLKEITEIIVEGEIDSQKSKLMGEQIILLQKALQYLKLEGLKSVEEFIVDYDELTRASEEEKVKRLIWLDLLPVIGTPESVTYIVQLIQENMNRQKKVISLFEARTILEALPLNIENPTERTITELSRLLDIIRDPQTPGYKFFHSASHLAVARVVRRLCTIDNGTEEEESSPRSLPMLRKMLRSEYNQYSKCPKAITKKFVQDVAEKLKNTDDRTQRIIYIQTLARTGLEEVLPILRKYVQGRFDYPSQSYINFVRSVTVHSLYHFTSSHPQTVISIVLPIYMNMTETTRLRNGAFGVILSCQPSLGLLQQIATQTWKESSLEVGNYVTSTLEAYGNSSIPCHKLTAHRIQKVLSQIKRFDNGVFERAQNRFWGIFDEQRGMGIEHRFEMTPSNESYIPAVTYQSLGYNTDSFKDTLFELAWNAQGFTTDDVWAKSLLKMLGIEIPQEIPKDIESKIFKEAEVVARNPEFWKYIHYWRMFYSTTYMYFDAEESNFQEMYQLFKEYSSRYINWNGKDGIEGHIVRVYLPSSYRTKTVGQTMPSPIEFEMKNPVVFSFRLKIKTESGSESSKYLVDIKPTIYYTTLYTHQYLNLGDCKDLGVYHQKRVALTYPAKLVFEMKRSGKISLAYTFPELPKTVFVYHSESGSFAGKRKLTSLPVMDERTVYKTIPSQFVKRNTFGLVGLPPLVSEILTEDIQFGLDEVPRTVEEATHYAVQHFLNAGWRRKSIQIKRVPESGIWTPSTEMKLNFYYNRDFVTPRSQSSEEWRRDLKFEDSLNRRDVSGYTTEGQQLYHKMRHQLNHVSHKMYIDVEQVKGSRYQPTAQLHLHYNHTLGGDLHLVHLQAFAISSRLNKPIEITADYGIAFTPRPNQFKFGSQTFGKQKGMAVCAITFANISTPFMHPDVVAKAVFGYKPLETVLAEEMVPTPSREHFYPETYEQCIEDVRNGKPYSIECIKAIREWSIFNNVRMHAVWAKELPTPVREVAEHLDMLLKHVFYHHISVEKKPFNKELRLEATYIDKMTDTPVVDVLLQKPNEILSYEKLSADYFTPVNSIDNMLESIYSDVTNNTHPATCVLMDKYVKTYDLMTYRLPSDMPACTYVLSTHCIDSKKFAVLVKIDPRNSITPEVHIYVGKDLLVLMPGSRSEYRIKYNGQEKIVKESRPQMLNEESRFYTFINQIADGSYILEVRAERTGIKVVYDGVNVKMQVHPVYKGEVCGLCSEFNGEIVKELRGMDRCLYSSSSDFVKSAMVGQCGDKTPKYPYICNDDEISHEDSWNREEGEEPTMKRNVVLSRDSELCFSTKPVAMCHNHASPRTTQPREMDFHCLPKQERNTRKLVTESKRRILGELETKSVDLTEIVQVAERC